MDRVLLYSSSEADISKNDPLGFSGAVIKCLIRGYFGKGHVVYTDNYYTSPQLAKYLNDYDTGLVGTLRKNRKNLPHFQEKNERGTLQKQEANGILVLKWTDKREILLLSTIHRGEMEETRKIDRKTGERIVKSDVVNDYNINMRLIDKSDMQISSVDCLRKSKKWSRKVFFDLLLNVYNMYVEGTGDKSSLRNFNKRVAVQLLQRFQLHSPVHVPSTPGRPRKGQRECVVCKTTSLKPKRRTKVTTMCGTCDVGLCIGSCFKAYHTLASFSISIFIFD